MLLTRLLSLMFAAQALLGEVRCQEDPAFFSLVNIYGGGSGVGLSTGDIDGDGDVDAAVTVNKSADSFDVLILKNDGRGVLIPLHYLHINQAITCTALADLNGDGKLDFAVGLPGQGLQLVAVMLGNGFGVFNLFALVPLSGAPEDLVIADLDQDGALDLVVAIQGARVAVSLGLGDGTFGSVTHHLVGSTSREVDVGDLNGDGALDIVAVSPADASLAVLLGDGVGGFLPAPSLALAGFPVDVALGQFDGDGLLDVVVANTTPNAASVFFGLGNGAFGGSVDIPTPGNGSKAVVAADLDEDGFDDVAFLPFQQVGVALSLGNGTFAEALMLQGDQLCFAVVAADMTGDGDLDLALAGTAPFSLGGSVPVLVGRGDGSFGHVYAAGTNGDGDDVQFGDFDGDGWPDMVLVKQGTDQLRIFPATGDGFFGAGMDLAMGNDPAGAAIGDFNGDALLDLAVIHTTFPGELRLLFGDGQFGFSAPTIINLPNLPVALESHDVDADLDLDLLVLNKSGMNVALLRNDGAGVFAAPELHAVSLLPLDLALGDLDGDGLLDLAVSTDLGQVDVLLDAGAGVYGPFTGYPAGQPGEDGLAIASGDLDEDGDVDLAVATANSGAVVLTNDGTGAFPTQSSFNPGNDKFTDVVIADYDLDGHLDLAVSAEHLGFPIKPSFVSVLFGPGDGSFPVAEVTPLAERPSALTAHDLDGDGVLDLATTGTEDTVYVLINQHGPWSSLGEALAGTKGLPKQVGTGPLQPGSGFAFTLTDGPPAAFTYHVLGLSALNAPFKGGVLVPDIGLISPALPTDSLGSASLTGYWPPGLSGLDVFTQFWHPDPAGVNGFAASNAVQASVP